MQNMVNREMKLSAYCDGLIVIGNGPVNLYWVINFYNQGETRRRIEEHFPQERVVIGYDNSCIHWRDKPRPVSGGLAVFQKFARQGKDGQ